MSLDADEEILQDFIVEADEIVEGLSEQLVELENRPEDRELLNAIFRGFHTIKGGAGFLQLNPLVAICHCAENVFDVLRNGEIAVSSALMDVILQAFDDIQAMFDSIRKGQMPEPANQEIIARLNALTKPGTAEPAAAKPAAPEPVAAQSDDITDDEFESLLDTLDGKTPATAQAAPVPESGDITEEEFDKLLDTLHGPITSAAPAAPEEPSNSDLITEDEFDQLLDKLHGSKPVKAVVAAPAEPAAKPVFKPAASKSNEVKPVVAAKSDHGDDKPEEGLKGGKPQAETTVRVDTRRLDDIMNMVGELVLVRNRLVRLGMANNDEEMTKAVSHLDVVTADLQASVMKTRMQPIKKVFGRFPRVVRDLARNLGKDINLEMRGEETDLDKNLVEALADPLIHLVRNSVDHGIEMPDDREAAGKNRQGTVVLSAQQEGDHILLFIEDDGAGMNPEKLKGIAVSKGVLDADAAERLSDTEAFDLIFAPGFSTKVEISDISGRGVGMDVVKTKIAQLNGSIRIQSTLGKGSKFIIKVPLTLAIMPTLMITLGQQAFALPLVNVNEIFHLDLSKTNVVDGKEVVVIREKALPLFHLKRWLVPDAVGAPPSGAGHVVVVSVGTQKVGFVVDLLVGQEEVVIKPLGRMLHGTPGMAGATITGDGRIALILDVPSMLNYYA